MTGVAWEQHSSSVPLEVAAIGDIDLWQGWRPRGIPPLEGADSLTGGAMRRRLRYFDAWPPPEGTGKPRSRMRASMCASRPRNAR